MAGNGWEWLEMAGNYWIRLEKAGLAEMVMTMMMVKKQMGWPYHSFDCVLLLVNTISQS